MKDPVAQIYCQLEDGSWGSRPVDLNPAFFEGYSNEWNEYTEQFRSRMLHDWA